MSFWNSTLIKHGRKAHRCEACFRAVEAGVPSYAESGLLDGDFHSYRVCVPCHDFIELLFELGNLEGGAPFYLSDLPEMARECEMDWPPLPAPPERGAHMDGGE